MYPHTPDISFAQLLGTVLIAFASGLPSAGEYPDITSLSDEDLVARLHLPEARREVERRLDERGVDEWRELRGLVAISHLHRGLPKGLSAGELIPLLSYWRSNDLSRVAAKELALLYEASTEDAKIEIYEQTKQYGLALDYLSESKAAEPDLTDAELEFNCFLHSSVSVFPEGKALDLLTELCLGRGYEGTARFLGVLKTYQGEKSAQTANLLRDLLNQLPSNDKLSGGDIETVGELRRLIMGNLGFCGEDGLDVIIEATDWLHHFDAIYAIGRINSDRAKEVLFRGYDATAPEWLEARLVIMQALIPAMNRSKDLEIRDFLRRELTPALTTQGSNCILARLHQAVGVAKSTQDHYYIRYLKQLEDTIGKPDFELAKEGESDSSETWSQRTSDLKEKIHHAVVSLERSTAWENGGV